MCWGNLCTLSMGQQQDWMVARLLCLFNQTLQDVIALSILVSSVQIYIYGICSRLIHIIMFWTLFAKKPFHFLHQYYVFVYIAPSLSTLYCVFGSLLASDSISPLVSRSGGHSLCGLLAALSRSPPHVLLRLLLVRVSNDSSQPLMRENLQFVCSLDLCWNTPMLHVQYAHTHRPSHAWSFPHTFT